MDFDQTVHFAETCGISQVRTQHRTLVAALELPDIEVDLAAVESVDTAFVQLIVCASVTATRRGKSFRVTGVPDAVAESFDRAGFAIAPETGRILARS